MKAINQMSREELISFIGYALPEINVDKELVVCAIHSGEQSLWRFECDQCSKAMQL